MADIIATHRVLRAALDQIALDQAHLRRLTVKLSETQVTVERARSAYRDSLRFISTNGSAHQGPDRDPPKARVHG